MDEPVEEGAAVVAERGGGVRVQTEPVLRSHSLASATSKSKAIFGQLFRTFLGFRFRGAGYTELSMAPVCYLLTLYRGESYTYTGDLSTEELTLLKTMVRPQQRQRIFKHRPSFCS